MSEKLRHLRYGNDDYLWIVDYNAMVISHPDPKIHGMDFSQVSDVRGTRFIPKMLTEARHNGESYVTYWWNRLNGQQPAEKLAYAKTFPLAMDDRHRCVY